MIYLTFLIFATFANLTASSPAPTDCPRTKCHTATNECNMLYGGRVNLSLIGSAKSNQTWQISCWDECEDIADRLKTFTNPLCPSSTPFFATSLSIASASPTFVPTIISDLFPSAGIAVERLSGAGLGGPHTECTPLSICVDAMNDCGVRYGGSVF